MTTVTTVRCAECGATATMPPLPTTLSHSCLTIPYWTVEPLREGTGRPIFEWRSADPVGGSSDAPR